ncbi:hypothetical protein GCM10023229_10110 [Flavisolibacter ginsenosidimutans]
MNFMKKILSLSFLLCLLSFQLTVHAQKGDPWIFQAYKEMYKRQPQPWELNINLYNQGHWNNYNELKQYVQQYQSSLSNMNIVTRTVPVKNNQSVVLFDQNGKSIAADLITNDGGSVITIGGANVVAAGGGNVVASGGGNLKDLPGASLGGSRQLMSGDKKIIKTSGSGAIIIR